MVPTPVGVRIPAETKASRPDPLDERALRHELHRHFSGDHLLLGLRVETDVAHDRLADELRADELADARAWLGGIVGDHREIALPLPDDLVDHAFRRADAHEAPDHQARTVRDHGNGFGEGYRFHDAGSVDNVIAAIDIKRFARDQLGAIHGEHGNGDADVVDGDEASARSFRLCLLQELVELADAGGGPCLERPWRDRMHSNALRSKLSREIAGRST